MADKKPPHLRDLFMTGREAVIEVFDDQDPQREEPVEVIRIWLRKPTIQQHEEAATKARGRQGRRRQKFRDQDSDEYLSVVEQANTYENKESIIEALMTYDVGELRQQAFNEALYGDNDDEEPKWGKEGNDYLDLLHGINSRHEEIAKYNDALPEEDNNLRIDPSQDEELVSLNSRLDEFTAQRDEIQERLVEKEKAKWMGESMDSLRKEYMKRQIDLEATLSFVTEYRGLMLYYSCREPDDHKKLYWNSPDEVWDLPEYVRSKLFIEYDILEQGADSLKNSPSLRPS